MTTKPEALAIATPESMARELNEYATIGSHHIQRSAVERSAARMILQQAAELETLRAMAGEVERLRAIVSAPRGTDAQIERERSLGWKSPG